MLEYILLSYAVMMLWCFKWCVCDYEEAKFCIKAWMIAPLSFPYSLVALFVRW